MLLRALAQVQGSLIAEESVLSLPLTHSDKSTKALINSQTAHPHQSIMANSETNACPNVVLQLVLTDWEPNGSLVFPAIDQGHYSTYDGPSSIAPKGMRW